MTTFDYELFVIGAGSGGVRAARTAARLGARVGIAEQRYYGGTCVNVGCVPKKLFVYASQFSEEFSAAQGFGWQLNGQSFSWQHLLSRKNKEIERLQQIYQNLLTQAGVTQYDGTAKLLDEHTVVINNQYLRAKRILIATGSWPALPELPGKEHVVTSNEMFALDTLPKRLLIVGGGYIAVEFAGIMHGLGVETSLCFRADAILRGFDDDIRHFLSTEMQKKGIQLFAKTVISEIQCHATGYTAITTEQQPLNADLVLYATGRKPNTAHLGLESVGIVLDDNGAIPVNNDYQTVIPSVYAIGDVTNRVNLTPVATAEAMVFAHRCYGNGADDIDYDLVPSAVFSQPNVGTVGLTEQQAKITYPDDIDVYRSVFTAMKHSLSGLNEKTLMKMLVRRSTEQVLGVHMVGESAGEIIQGMAVALKAGATKASFDATIGIHPTAAEEFVTMRTPS